MAKYRRGSGGIYKRGKTWWLKYYVKGKPVYESSGFTDRAEARRILQAKLGQIAEGRYTGPAADRVTFEDLAEDFLNDYRANARKSLGEAERRVKKHLARFFTGKRAHSITTADVRSFITARQEEKASNGEINRELAALKRMFNLALHADKITKKPYIPLLEEDNVRQGFFERPEFEALLARLPDWLRPPAAFSYQVGWRIRSEVLPLTWDRINLQTGIVRLEVGTTKNKRGRLICLPMSLLGILERQWQDHIEHYPDCPYVFHRNGKRIRYPYVAWRKACQEAGLQGKIPHDFRRTAVRNMVIAGIPERVAMEIAGHKTRSIFDRYHIVSEGDLRAAAKRLDEVFPVEMVTDLVTNGSQHDAETHLTN